MYVHLTMGYTFHWIKSIDNIFLISELKCKYVFSLSAVVSIMYILCSCTLSVGPCYTFLYKYKEFAI